MVSEAGWLEKFQSINQSIFSMPTELLDGRKVFEPSIGVLPTTGWLIANRPITALVLGLLSLGFVAVTWKVML